MSLENLPKSHFDVIPSKACSATKKRNVLDMCAKGKGSYTEVKRRRSGKHSYLVRNCGENKSFTFIRRGFPVRCQIVALGMWPLCRTLHHIPTESTNNTAIYPISGTFPILGPTMHQSKLQSSEKANAAAYSWCNLGKCWRDFRLTGLPLLRKCSHLPASSATA